MSTQPTIVFRNGVVFCSDAAQTWASAVAIEGGRIRAVGGDTDVQAYLSRAEEVVDLDGRLLTPGFLDAHVHPFMGGIERMRCDLSALSTADEFLDAVGEYAQSHPDEQWILGGGWAMAAFENGTPTREDLDKVCSERPVLLPNRDHHSAWVNSRALELAGIDENTPDPSDGRIERDAFGRPTGCLHEGAMYLVAAFAPDDSLKDHIAGLRVAQSYLHSLGVVGWQDAMVPLDGADQSSHAAYLQAQHEGWLTAKVRSAVWWNRDCAIEDVGAQLGRIKELRSQAREGGGRYRVDNVKVMVDGVLETFTAAMIDPYLDRCGCPGHNTGLNFLDPELLKTVTTAIDAAGFGVHFHALGDRAVRDALNAVSAARSANGTNDHRHHLAHLQVVHPEDRGRFRELGVAANLQAFWAAHDEQMDELAIPYLGPDRARWQYPFGDLHRDGATLVMGSDWPVSTPDPWAAIHVAVNRRNPHAPTGTEPLGPEQALPLATALRAYTAGSAWVNRLDGASGTIAAGYDADLVVLDRNPFDAPRDEIARTTVQRTYIAGELVHQSD